MKNINKIIKQSFNWKVASFGATIANKFWWGLYSRMKSLRDFANFRTRGKFPIECFWKGLFSMSCGLHPQEFFMSNGFGLGDFWMNPWGKSQEFFLPFLRSKTPLCFWYEKGFAMVAKNMLFRHQLCSGHAMIDSPCCLSSVAKFQLKGSA